MTRGPPVGISAVILRNGKNSLKAVRKAVTNASFCAPEISNVANKVVSWIEEFAEKAASEVVLLSGHYYAEWPPEDPRMTIGRLLERDPRLPTNTPRRMEVSRKSHRPFRMTEGNSCYNGGKRGVSDTFASALWAADYMLFLAQSGYAGVNFHGGGNGIYTPIAWAPRPARLLPETRPAFRRVRFTTACWWENNSRGRRWPKRKWILTARTLPPMPRKHVRGSRCYLQRCYLQQR